MAVHPARLSCYPVQQGAVLLIEGIPQSGDMLRIKHDNGTHTAAYVEAVSSNRMALTLNGDFVPFRMARDQGGEPQWIAEAAVRAGA